MRWKKPTPNETRIIKTFAILPITINNETRWLESCKIRQSYSLGVTGCGDLLYAWQDIKFID